MYKVKSQDAENFSRKLLGGAKDVAVILGESPDPEHSMEHARSFIAVYRTQLGVADRQIPVTSPLILIDQDVAGAVSWAWPHIPLRRRRA